MKQLRFYLTMLLLMVVSVVSAQTEQMLAFPGADGYGRYTTGGRGGEVCYVTRLDDCSDNNLVEGTLRWAIRHDNGGKPRTILFATSGTIYLTSKLKFQYPDVSILGQSAPGGGVTITGYNMYICKDNVIIRYVRFRAGDIPNTSMTGLDMENCQNVILDHCSMTWSMEECLTAYDSKYTTVQWCIIGEGLYSSKNAKGARAYATQWGGEHSTMHHTLITNSHSRSPRFNGARDAGPGHDTYVDSEFANNVVFNWSGTGAIYGGEMKSGAEGYNRVYMINNFYRPGPSSKAGGAGPYIARPSSPYGQWYANGNKLEETGTYTPWSQASAQAANADNTKAFNGLPSQYIMSSVPYALSGLQYESADAAFTSVTTKAGASLPRYDEVDRRLLDEAAGIVAPKYYASCGKNHLGIIDSPSDVTLSYPDEYVVNGEVHHDMPKMFFEGTDKYFIDSDADGMPDGYEDEQGLDKNNPADGAADSGNGYTNLEVYLNAIADGTISPAQYCTSTEFVEPGPQTEDPEFVTYTFSKGTVSGVEGAAPAAITVPFGTKITIPRNHTLYREGYTLTQWSTGANLVQPGDMFSSKRDITLTASFTQNKTNLEGRTSDVTIIWDFTADDAPASLSGSGIFITQANFAGADHDVKLSYDNGKLTIPACASAQYRLEGNTIVEGTADSDVLTVDAPEGLKTVTITLPYIWNTPDRIYHSPDLGEASDFELFYTTKETVLASDWISATYLDYAQYRTFYDPAVDDDVTCTDGSSSHPYLYCVVFNGSDRTYDMFVKNTKKIKAFLCHQSSNADQCYMYAYPSDGSPAIYVRTPTISVKQQPANLELELDPAKSYRIQLYSRKDFDWAIGAVKLYGDEPDIPTTGTVSALWPWEGTYTEDATLTPKRIFKSAKTALGSKVVVSGSKSNMKVIPNETMIAVQADNNTQEIDENSIITFTLTPNAGISFTPEHLSFNAVRCGTGSINYTVTIQQGAGEEKVVIDGKNPSRDNEEPSAFRPDNLDLTTFGFTSSADPLTIRMKLYNFFKDPNTGVIKDMAINKFNISGTFNGKAPEVKKYTFDAVASDPAAGTVTWTPSGTEFEEGTSITVEANANSGYLFDKWTSAEGNVVGTAAIYTFKIDANTSLIANFNKVGEGDIFSDGPFQAIVSNASELTQALADAKAKTAADATLRYRIFLKNGIYDFGTVAKTAIPLNTSLVGESEQGVLIKNNPGDVTSSYQDKTPVLFIDQNQNDVYLQDMTICQARDWETKVSKGQALALRQRGKRAIYKNVSMQGVQDTYYLNKADGSAYFETSTIAGNVDYIYGDGTMWFEQCHIQHVGNNGGYVTAPNTQTGYMGVVFNNCDVTAEKGDKSYYLGRPWNDSPAATFLHTTFNSLPKDAGWGGMTSGLVVRFHEYGSKDANGNLLDLSARNISACNAAAGSDSPVLTAEQAAQYTIAKVFQNVAADWQPQTLAQQVTVPTLYVSTEKKQLTWQPAEGAYCYAIVKDGSVIDFTTSTYYNISDLSATYQLRAANHMGGLGAASANAVEGWVDGIMNVTVSADSSNACYNLAGQRINASAKGIQIRGGKKYVR